MTKYISPKIEIIDMRTYDLMESEIIVSSQETSQDPDLGDENEGAMSKEDVLDWDEASYSIWDD